MTQGFSRNSSTQQTKRNLRDMGDSFCSWCCRETETSHSQRAEIDIRFTFIHLFCDSISVTWRLINIPYSCWVLQLITYTTTGLVAHSCWLVRLSWDLSLLHNCASSLYQLNFVEQSSEKRLLHLFGHRLFFLRCWRWNNHLHYLNIKDETRGINIKNIYSVLK